MRNRASLMWLLSITFLLSVIWVFVVPTEILEFQPDERSHIFVTRFMAAHWGTLPPYQMGFDTSVHPPLYHTIAAVLFSMVYPVMGDDCAIIAVRLLSAIIGVGTIYFVYLMARQSALCRPVAVPIAAVAALIPMRVSLSGAATNENLAALGAAAALFFLFIAIRRGFTNRRLLLLAFWTMVAVGSKVTCLGLLPAIAIGAILARRPDQPLWRVGTAVCAPVVAVLFAFGWWFVYNTVHYGDPVRKGAADRLWNGVQPGYAGISEQTGILPWRYLLSILGGGWFSFWGQFNSMQYRMPTGVYIALLAVHGVSLWGIASRSRSRVPLIRTQFAMLTATSVFAAWVFLIYVQYNWSHYTPQGRYFFVLLGPVVMILVGGIHLFLRRYLQNPQWHRWIWILSGIALLALNLFVLKVTTQ